MKKIELFAGIGGISLAARWAGIESKAFCEQNTFCQKVLKKHWPNAPIISNVEDMNRNLLEELGVIERNGTIDILAGGYPCQGESQIGDRKGEDDERWLWPNMFGLVEELRPTWVIGENVVGHITMGLDAVLSDLESRNYQARPFVLPAYSVGAPHQRYRVFVVAHAYSKSKSQAHTAFSTFGKEWNAWQNSAGRSRGKVPRTYWEKNKSPVCGMDDGFSSRLDRDRLKALGNAVVPQQIYPIFKAIKAIHDQECAI